MPGAIGRLSAAKPSFKEIATQSAMERQFGVKARGGAPTAGGTGFEVFYLLSRGCLDGIEDIVGAFKSGPPSPHVPKTPLQSVQDSPNPWAHNCPLVR